MTGFLYGRLARFEISPQATLGAGLDRLGYAAGDVKTVVISHLHQDHIGVSPSWAQGQNEPEITGISLR
jgi:N-acyl homoserine lactone hydrolase